MSPALRSAIDGVAAAIWLFLAGRTVRTGVPGGSARLFSRRERPVQFWSAAAAFFVLGLWYAARAAGA